MYTYNPATFNTSGIASVIGNSVRYNDGQYIDFDSNVLSVQGIDWIKSFNGGAGGKVTSIIGNSVRYANDQYIDFDSNVLEKHGIEKINAYNDSGVPQ